MEEITIELDDELAEWLELVAAERKKSAAELVAELIRERRENLRASERETD
jgi:predicted transcriptional regulator